MAYHLYRISTNNYITLQIKLIHSQQKSAINAKQIRTKLRKYLDPEQANALYANENHNRNFKKENEIRSSLRMNSWNELKPLCILYLFSVAKSPKTFPFSVAKTFPREKPETIKDGASSSPHGVTRIITYYAVIQV